MAGWIRPFRRPPGRSVLTGAAGAGGGPGREAAGGAEPLAAGVAWTWRGFTDRTVDPYARRRCCSATLSVGEALEGVDIGEQGEVGVCGVAGAGGRGGCAPASAPLSSVFRPAVPALHPVSSSFVGSLCVPVPAHPVRRFVVRYRRAPHPVRRHRGSVSAPMTAAEDHAGLHEW